MTADVRREGMPDAHVIVIDQDVSRDRQRFTIAHEIGHMVLAISPGMDRELAVHRFAAAFLMPVEALWSSLGRHRTNIDWRELLGLKLAFGMSIQADHAPVQGRLESSARPSGEGCSTPSSRLGGAVLLSGNPLTFPAAGSGASNVCASVHSLRGPFRSPRPPSYWTSRWTNWTACGYRLPEG